MKQVVVPTSPKSPDSQEAQEKKNRPGLRGHLMFIVIVSALLFGALAGFFGFVIAANLPSDLPVFGDLKAGLTADPELRTILYTDRKLSTTLLKLSPDVVDQIVPVYSEEPRLGGSARFMGNAVVLTADGWMVMPTVLLPAQTDTVAWAAIVVVLPSGELKSIQKTIPDPLTGMTYFFVNSVNVAVVNFQSAEPMDIGQLVSGVEAQMGATIIYERRIAGEAQRTNTVRTTRDIQQDFVIDQSGGALPVGMPFFYNSGVFAGVLTEGQILIPGVLLSSGLNSIISSGTIDRSSIDVSYINIDRLTKQERQTQDLPEHGIWITAVQEETDPANPTIPLIAGDVITHINNTFLDEQSDIGTLIHSQPTGFTFFFTIRRGGQEQVLEWKS